MGHRAGKIAGKIRAHAKPSFASLRVKGTCKSRELLLQRLSGKVALGSVELGGGRRGAIGRGGESGLPTAQGLGRRAEAR